MSDFFSRLESELAKAAERRAGRRLLPQVRWTRRTVLVLIPATVLVAVPAFAAVSGVFHVTHHRHVGRVHGPVASGGGVVDLGPHSDCHFSSIPQPPKSSAPPPQQLSSVLGVLRRPRTKDDGPAIVPDLLQTVAGVNPDYVRVAQRLPDGTTLIVMPAQNIHARPPVPHSPGCREPVPPVRAPEPGVCLIVRARAGASAGCQTVAQLERGMAPGGFSGPYGRDAVELSAIVPDGVTSVSLVYRQRGRVRRVEARVIDNTYAVLVHGLNAMRAKPTVLWHGTAGTRAVVKGGPTVTPRERKLMRRSLARDRHATRVPSVYPRAGTRRAIFTLRVRPPHPKSRAGIYVVTVTGPSAGNCRRQASRRFGAVPATHGVRKGVIDILYGPGEVGGGGKDWCPGTYNGTIELWPHGFHRRFSHHVYARFQFSVR